MCRRLPRYAVLLLMVSTLGIGSCDARDPEFVPSADGAAVEQVPTAVPSSARTRTWHDIPSDPVLTLGAEGESLLYPAEVRVATNGHIYVLDYGALQVKEFSPAGALVRVYGKGRGGGPGEMQNPTDFALGPAGTVWVLDPALGRIMIFDREGEALRTIQVDASALRLVVYSDGSFTTHTINEYLFAAYDSAAQRTRSFGRLVDAQLERGLALQGYIAPIGTADLVYAPMRAGYIARFARDGGLTFYRETIDPSPFPQLQILPNGGRRIHPDDVDRISALSVATAGNEIFLRGSTERDGRRVGVIDVYSASDGAYLYSMQTPERGVQSVYLTDDHLYTVGEMTVRQWQRPEKD